MGPQKLLVFVADGKNQSRTWSEAISRLAVHDGPRLYAKHVVPVHQSQASQTAGKSVVRHRSMEDATLRLVEFLNSDVCRRDNLADDPELTLVARDRGCLVLQKTVLDQLAQNADARFVHSIRSIVFINRPDPQVHAALPTALVIFTIIAFLLQRWDPITGSLFLKVAIAVIGALVTLLVLVLGSLPFEEGRRFWGLGNWLLVNRKLNEAFEKHVMNGSKKQTGAWPIPCTLLAVPRFDVNEQIHINRLWKAIVTPAPHPSLYQVDLLERRLKIRRAITAKIPRVVGDLVPERFWSGAGGHDQADYRIYVHFSRSNLASDKRVLDGWKLRYSSKKGIVDVRSAHTDNEWAPEYIEQYKREHRSYEYHFVPKPSGTYGLDVTVYGGYSDSDQNNHIHFRSDTYYNTVRHTVDLSDLLAQGWTIRKPVEATLVQHMLPDLNPTRDRLLDTLECDCAERSDVATQIRKSVPVEENGGVYSWELEGVRDGGILVFEFAITRDPETVGTGGSSRE